MARRRKEEEQSNNYITQKKSALAVDNTGGTIQADLNRNRVPELKKLANTEQVQRMATGAPASKKLSGQAKNAALYQENLEAQQKKYSFDEDARNKNTLERRDGIFSKSADQDILQRVYDRFGEESARNFLKQSNQTKDWESKYGKSYDEIMDDFLADQGNVRIETGQRLPILTEIGTAINSIPNALLAGGSILTNLIAPDSKVAQTAEQIRSQNTDAVNQGRAGVKLNTGDFGDKVIDTVNSVADRMVNTLAGGAAAGKVGSGVMAGLSDANTQLQDLALRPEISNRQKAASALAHGAVEGIGTGITAGILDKLPVLDGLKGSLMNIAKGAGNAAFENAVSEAIEMGTDTAINKENSQKELNKQLYMLQGMSEREAENQAKKDQYKQVGNAALMGALFGGGLQGAKEVRNAANIPSIFLPSGTDAEHTPSINKNYIPPVETNNVEVPSPVLRGIEGEDRLGLPEFEQPKNVIPMPGTNGVIELPENPNGYIDGLRSAFADAKPVEKAHMLIDGGYYKDSVEAGKAYRNGTLDADVEDYISKMERNGNPASTKQKTTVNKYNSDDLKQKYNDDWIAMRKGTIQEYTGSDETQTENYYNELQKFVGGSGRTANTEVLDDYVEHAPTYEGQISRGMHFGIGDQEYDDFMNKVHEGGVVTLDKPSSWASDRAVSRLYSHMGDDNCDSIEIVCNQNRTSTPIDFINSQGESEVLSSSKASWTVLNEDTITRPNGARKTILYVAETGDKTPPKNAVVIPDADVKMETNGAEPSEVKSEIGNVPPTDVGDVIDNVEGKRTKTSKTYTNTGRYGKGWTEEEYAKYTDPSQFQYEDISEMESMQDAAGMLQSEGLEGFKNRVMDKDRLTSKEIDGLMMEWRIISQQARMMEEAGEDAGDAWKESVKVFRKIQEQSTSNAQALQALAKWSRNTAEGMLAEAENILNGKKKMSQPDKSTIQKEFEKFAKQNKKFHFSDEFAEEFLKKAKPLEDMDRESREAKELMAELGKMVNRQLPAKLGEKAMTVLMDNMLGNFRTLITRNAGGNIGLNAVEQVAQRPLAALIDMGVSKKTGKRTQAGLSKEGLAEYVQGFTKGLKEELEDFKNDIHTARSGENDLANAVSQNRHVFKEKGVADKLDKLVRHGLSVGDRPFYEAVYNQTLGDYQRLRASGQMGDVVQSLSDADFDAYAQTAAKLNALSAVYQQDSKMAKALLSFKGAISDLSRGVVGADILSQFSMPFVKTPANVVERAIDYSPLGMVRNTIRTAKELNNDAFDQNRFVNESARNILGTGLMAGGAGLAANGVMSGSYSEDKDEKQAQKEAGMQEYAWNVPDWLPGIGGKQMDIGWVPVVGSNLVASAAAYDAYKNGEGGFGQNLAKGIEAGGQALFDQSMFQGLQRLFGTGEAYDTDTGIVGNMANVVKSGVGQLIPSLARQAGQVIDPYQRDIGNSNEGVSFGMFDNYDLNNLANNIPFLRETALAPKVNTSGELVQENQGRNMVSKVLEDMILPGKLTEVQMSPLADEAKRLSDITTTKDAYMPKATRAVDTEGHTLSNEEWVDYQQKYYSELTSAGTMLMNNDYYKQADPAKQEKLLHDVYSDMRKAINSTYTGKEGSQTGAAKKYLEAGGGEKGMQEVVNYHLAAQKAKDLGMETSTYLKKEAEAPGSADRWAQERDDAVKYGFTQKDGSANVDAYDTALSIVGNDPRAMQAYSDYYKQGFTKNDQKLPYLMNNNAFTDEQKGKIIVGDKKYDDLGNTAKGAYDIQGYEGLYYYYLLKQLADTDGNGSIKKAEKNDLLNSDNPYVTSLSDDMYYYLANAKW